MHGVVPPGSHNLLTADPRVAASPKTFCRCTFLLTQRGTEVWNLFLKPKLLLLRTDYLGVSEHHLHQH